MEITYVNQKKFTSFRVNGQDSIVLHFENALVATSAVGARRKNFIPTGIINYKIPCSEIKTVR